MPLHRLSVIIGSEEKGETVTCSGEGSSGYLNRLLCFALQRITSTFPAPLGDLPLPARD